jgi:adenine-specific DNA-methyltransferase
LRLTPSLRKRILSGDADFGDAERLLAHKVPQSRFRGNQHFQFDVDVTASDEVVLGRIRRESDALGDYLVSTRGVELSKSGRVCYCSACGLWVPLPTRALTQCRHCGAPLNVLENETQQIVSDRRLNGHRRLVVGEDICRYGLMPRRWLDISKRGINYKAKDSYWPPKLLVRKTGVGISAAVDYSRAMTNQVVYTLKPLPGDQDVPPIEFYLGILNSRAMYYYLTKRCGETEWRSHPYLTQKHLMELPVPRRRTIERQHDLVLDIVDAVRPYTTHRRTLPPEVDARVEGNVARLYGLGRRHYQVIYETLDSVEQLLPVRALRRVPISAVFG